MEGLLFLIIVYFTCFSSLLSDSTTRYRRGQLPVVRMCKVVSSFISYLSAQLDARVAGVCLHALMRVSDTLKSFRNAKTLQTGVLAAIMSNLWIASPEGHSRSRMLCGFFPTLGRQT